MKKETERVVLGNLLIVDDDQGIRRLLRSALAPIGYRITEAASAEEGLEKLRESPPDLVLLDVQLPGRSGHEMLDVIRGDPRTRLLPVVMLTGDASREQKLKAIESGVTDFIAKPFSVEELTTRVRSLVQLKLFTDDLEHAEQVIVALAKTVDARDPYTASHSERVSYYAGLLAERAGLAAVEVAAVKRGGLFHDLGKIAIRDSVLFKPGKLTVEEYAEIKRHPVEGVNLLKHLKSISSSLDVVHHHHERMDGSGYPDGLMGESIPLTARITNIADIFDALTSNRPYRNASSRGEALEIMRSEVGKGWWDGRLLEEFSAVLQQLPDTGPGTN